MLDKLGKDDRILILSPHLDDAVLSAGGLMDRAVQGGATVVAATIFTADAEFDGEPSPFVQELHAWWNLGAKPYEARRAEDIVSIRSLGADYIHAGMLDAIYRRDDSGKFLYASRKAVFSPPNIGDPVREPLRALFADWMGSIRPTVILCPMTVGRHIDHVITSEVFRSGYPYGNTDLYLYEDMPYSGGLFPTDFPDSVAAAIGRTAWKIKQPIDIDVDFKRKFEAIMKYASQIGEIFPGLDAEQELKRYMDAGDGKAFKERFWLVDGVIA
ncbi:PIG-L family deacetylase [Rhizobium sp. P38BS-XIX]|uniref:PIG-L deacetylase family protein n=1 Tax=Rhizobium sp. P38BS-XIX TaxID=2726740 RepID=UPI0014569794|nr:PIG-L family deacetylase [Rhizobium sp. P38BS-XIX]NLS01032.1 PIG-L family deacetylase [Rhizobium sp. P38BS-XIX]